MIIVLSKIDILDEEHELQQIIEWLKEQSRKFLDIDPLIFPVSAKKPLKAKLSTSGGNPLHSVRLLTNSNRTTVVIAALTF